MLIPLQVGPATDISIKVTPERIERGEYLASHVWICLDCHSKKSEEHYSGPVIPGTEGMGGQIFDSRFGRIYATNITPYELDSWTDGEIVRAITEGVNKNGEPLFPFMPYTLYGQMDREDVYSVVAYLRTLQPILHDVPKRELKQSAKYLVRKMPRNASLHPRPDRSDTAAYGEYLSIVCYFCHTPQKRGKPDRDMLYAGGVKHRLPSGEVVQSTNITPDEETGIGNKSKDNFIGIFKAFDSQEAREILIPTREKGSDTSMPWTLFAGMTQEDLGAIYNYLRTIQPVKNKVEKYPLE
jgi:hypothetical protein|tara:strand:+ start:22342 stop:23232 length:891 start_codon:yes stop_codon:yes gene_type:complete